VSLKVNHNSQEFERKSSSDSLKSFEKSTVGDLGPLDIGPLQKIKLITTVSINSSIELLREKVTLMREDQVALSQVTLSQGDAVVKINIYMLIKVLKEIYNLLQFFDL
jgi:hypothetical protein